MTFDYGTKFEQGLTYEAFLEKYADQAQRQKWGRVHQQITLTEPQTKLLSQFVRDMKIMVMAGTWCGDCASQCPIFAHFAAASPQIDVRFFDRDDHPDLAQQLLTCGAARVPGVLFVSEDNFLCGRYGDHTLAAYRDKAENQLGATCSTGLGGMDPELFNQIVQEWLDQFERIQLMLRLSGRLRGLHGD